VFVDTTSPTVDIYLNLIYNNSSESDHTSALKAVYGAVIELLVLDELEFDSQAGTTVELYNEYPASLTFVVKTINELG
jgi:hypothetical protein